MNKLDKVLLFVSYDQGIPQKFVYDHVQKLFSSPIYTFLNKNIERGLEICSPYIEDIEKSRNTLNYNCENLEQYFIVESKIYYLATQSFERYYLNPVLIDDAEVKLKSLGDLLFPFDKELLPFNAIVNKQGYSLEYKKRAVKDKMNEYQKEAERAVEEKLRIINSHNLTKARLNVAGILGILKFTLAILLNFFMLFCFWAPGIRNSINHVPGNTSTWLNIFFWSMVAGTIFYSSFYILTSVWHNKIYDPLFYTRRVRRIRPIRIKRMIRNRIDEVEEYFISALEKKKLLKDDIRKFAKLGNSVIDLEVLSKINDGLNKKEFRLVTAIKNILFGIMILIAIAFTVVLVIFSQQHGGVL